MKGRCDICKQVGRQHKKGMCGVVFTPEGNRRVHRRHRGGSNHREVAHAPVPRTGKARHGLGDHGKQDAAERTYQGEPLSSGYPSYLRRH